jgi:Fic family protein
MFNLDRRTFAPDEPAHSGPDVETLRDAYLDKLTDPANGYTLDKVFPLPADLPALYAQLTELKLCLDSFRPLDPMQAEKLREVFDTEYTFNSNKIEGNTLTHVETHLVINKGLTIAGKSLREHLEATNHQEAIHLIRDLAAGNEDVTDRNLRRIHAVVLHAIDHANAGAWRRERVRITGTDFIPPHDRHVPDLMDKLFAFYDTHKASMHPVELAAQFHQKLVAIHPFIDGNGRTARLVMNLILLRAGYPITILSAENQQRSVYYQTLDDAAKSETGENVGFQHFIAENVRRQLLQYLDLVGSDVSLEGKLKGDYFFKAIAPSLAPRST